ncbi:hypothetical protein [Mycobacterium sp.]|uniref:hypothetical protein n=1 Tax=Mycobacterium sp. TaxID=1785 RepID=UPI003C78E654
MDQPIGVRPTGRRTGSGVVHPIREQRDRVDVVAGLIWGDLSLQMVSSENVSNFVDELFAHPQRDIALGQLHDLRRGL